MTPLEAIRKKCVDCSGYEYKEVSDCNFGPGTFDECSLYPFRIGIGHGLGSKVKAIRKYCLWCMCNQTEEVKLCVSNNPAVPCSLYEFRMGHNPQRKGKSGRTQEECTAIGYKPKKSAIEQCSDKSV